MASITVTPEMSSETKSIIESLEMAHAEIEKLKKYLDIKFTNEAELEKRIEILERENQEVKDYASDLEEYVLQLDSSTRKRNIVISGLSEGKGESSDALAIKVFKFLQPYMETIELEDIDCTYRLGKKMGKSRPVLCKFLKEKTRNEVFAIRSELNDTDSLTRVYLNDDLPQLINERRSNFRIISKLAKAQKIPVSYQNDRITVNNITYKYRDIDCLPNGLRLQDAKIVKVKGGIAFHSENAWLSNFYPCKIVLQGITFTSSEQAFQYTRALRLKEPHTASLILRSRKAVQAKRLGKSITTTTPEWDNDRFDVMRRITSEKFSQNYQLAGKLISSGQEQLIEATIDGFWGAKASINSKAIRDGSWMGANFLGKILQEVRDELRRDMVYSEFLNARLEVTVDYTPQTLPPTQAQPTGQDPVTSDDQDQLISVANITQRQQTKAKTRRENQRSLSTQDNTSLFTQETPSATQGRKNKIRPASDSSHEGVSPNDRPAFKKKLRIYSPKSALPPVRPIADLFGLPASTDCHLDVGIGTADFV